MIGNEGGLKRFTRMNGQKITNSFKSVQAKYLWLTAPWLAKHWGSLGPCDLLALHHTHAHPALVAFVQRNAICCTAQGCSRKGDCPYSVHAKH